MITSNVIDLIGNTPLIKLKYPSEISGCEIYGKAEFMNPGGSVKDRTALGIILDAEEKKLLEPGGTVVEGTFGNTGIGLALVCNAKNYNLKDKSKAIRCLLDFVLEEKNSWDNLFKKKRCNHCRKK